MVEFEGSDSDREIRQGGAHPCRLHLSVDLSGAQSDRYGHRLNRHSR